MYNIHEKALEAAQRLESRIACIEEKQLFCLNVQDKINQSQKQLTELEGTLSDEVAFSPEFKNDTQRKAALTQLRANTSELLELKERIQVQGHNLAVSQVSVEALKNLLKADRAIIDLSVAILGSK